MLGILQGVTKNFNLVELCVLQSCVSEVGTALGANAKNRHAANTAGTVQCALFP